MSPQNSEKLLAYIYPLITCFGFVCGITSAITWNHWKYVLDTCVDRNCGCILNGVSTITYFTGGHIFYCHFATFGLVVSVVVATVFGSYYVWRICISTERHKMKRHSMRQRYFSSRVL